MPSFATRIDMRSLEPRLHPPAFRFKELAVARSPARAA